MAERGYTRAEGRMLTDIAVLFADKPARWRRKTAALLRRVDELHDRRDRQRIDNLKKGT